MKQQNLIMLKVKYYLTVLAILSIAISAYCQTGYVRLLGLTVEGNVTADEGLIRANSGLIVGSEISGDNIQMAIKQIWQLGLFADIQILLEQEVADGVFLKILVNEYPRLEKIEVSGNKKMKKDEIEEVLDFYPGQIIRPHQIMTARRELLDAYGDEGYLHAEVNTTTTVSEETDRIILRLDIAEGKKVKIKSITFHGNEAHEKKKKFFPLSTVYWTVDWLFPDDPFTSGKLRGKMKETKQKGIFRSGDYNEEEFQDDQELVIEHYKNHGYRDAMIVTDSVKYSDDKRRLFLDVWVDEGKQYYFGEMTFSGNTLYEAAELVEQLLFERGDVYDKEKLDITVHEKLTNLYYDRGYIYANVSPVEIPTGDDTLNIHFKVFEGNEFKVRRILIEGNTKTRENVIRREFVLDPGDTFNVTKLYRSAREVTILNYFSNIIPDVQPINDQEVDLIFEVEEKSTDQIQMSAGYSELDGMIGSLGFTMPNLFGTGKSFSLNWQFGRIYRTFSVSLTEPWFLDTPTLVGVSFFDTRRGGSYYGFDEDIIGGSLRAGRRLRWPDDYFRIDWIYRLESALYSNFTTSFAQSNPQGLVEDEPRISSGITTILTRDSRDNPEFPTIGSVNRYSIELTGGILGGNDRYHKHIFTSQWYRPVLGPFVLYLDTEMGVVSQFTNTGQAVPYMERFFMGGSGLSLGIPLRGYDERVVGPQSGGYAAGGKTMFKQSFELRLPVVYSPTIFLLGFAEAGNVWYDLESTDVFDLRRSVGLGVRLYMPMIGLIGLDYGYGIDYFDPTTGERKGEWIPHFQFGRGF
ncbi:outer membrane protein assembly factor BamA [candidate division LCP-89 bacterium B3_LCP]|uniref:Outer membrane protein assembly factor BamA n=1 Tax=candidate division LCP-89 bacterium B3_LCP TaxID=2012998 RepID=A0A532UXY5_UNCL8|nr:MAG: outer membrane protein assembly factor BamA [candidate division LCP-89 bacterium B3_LCP]